MRLRLCWARLGAALALCALTGWMLLAAAAWSFVRYRRGVETVSYFDFVLPSRWDDYRRKSGDRAIARAKERLEEKDVRSAFTLLRVGVAKSPGNLEGRRYLAQILAVYGRPDRGLEVLEDGLAYAGDDLAYLQTYLALLLRDQQDQRVIEMARDELPRLPPDAERARMLALAAATASYYRGNYDQAEDLLTRHRLDRERDGRLLQARIDWERGYPELAELRLRAMIRQAPGEEAAYGLLFNFLREQKRFDEARRLGVLRSAAFPQSIPARLALIYIARDDGKEDRAREEIERLLADFPHDQRALAALAELAIATGDVKLADRLGELAAGADLAPQMAVLVALHARLAAGEYREAQARAAAIIEAKPDWLEREAGSLAGVQAVACYGLGDPELGDVYLSQFLQHPSMRVEALLTIASRLQAAGAQEAARRVLAQASEADALNQAALTALIELDLSTGNRANVPRNLERLLTMRKPSLPLLRRAYRQLASDRWLFTPDRGPLLADLQAAIDRRDRKVTAWQAASAAGNP